MNDLAQSERIALLLVAVYLGIIGTWKLRMMHEICRATRQHTLTLQIHSRRIAAILELVSTLPDGTPTQQTARRAQLYTIVQQAKQEIEEEDTATRTIPFRR